jgi:hypothetical protein
MDGVADADREIAQSRVCYGHRKIRVLPEPRGLEREQVPGVCAGAKIDHIAPRERRVVAV